MADAWECKRPAYHWPWLVRVYLIAEMRHASVCAPEMTQDWDAAALRQALRPDHNEWLPLWLSWWRLQGAVVLLRVHEELRQNVDREGPPADAQADGSRGTSWHGAAGGNGRPVMPPRARACPSVVHAAPSMARTCCRIDDHVTRLCDQRALDPIVCIMRARGWPAIPESRPNWRVLAGDRDHMT